MSFCSSDSTLHAYLLGSRMGGSTFRDGLCWLMFVALAAAQVERVAYPGLPSSRFHALACKQFGGSGGGVLAFDVRGGKAAARALLQVQSPPKSSHSPSFSSVNPPLQNGIVKRSLRHGWGVLPDQALTLPLIAPSLGSVESLITMPSETTHLALGEEGRKVGGTDLSAVP